MHNAVALSRHAAATIALMLGTSRSPIATTVQVAELLSQYLHRKGLDSRGTRPRATHDHDHDRPGTHGFGEI
jgi:hypothetical protein